MYVSIAEKRAQGDFLKEKLPNLLKSVQDKGYNQENITDVYYGNGKLYGINLNNIERIPFNQLDVPHLSSLKIANSSIGKLKIQIEKIPQLRSLELLNTRINFVDEHSFSANKNLEVIKMKSVELGEKSPPISKIFTNLSLKILMLKNIQVDSIPVIKLDNSLEKQTITLYNCGLNKIAIKKSLAFYKFNYSLKHIRDSNLFVKLSEWIEIGNDTIKNNKPYLSFLKDHITNDYRKNGVGTVTYLIKLIELFRLLNI